MKQIVIGKQKKNINLINFCGVSDSVLSDKEIYDNCRWFGQFTYSLHRRHNGHTIASQITSLTIVYSTVYSDADQRKYQSSASLAFVRGIHRGPVNSPHKWPVTRKMFPFDDVIMASLTLHGTQVTQCAEI